MVRHDSAEPVQRLSIATLGVIDEIDKLSAKFTSRRELYDVFGDLGIVKEVLAESVLTLGTLDHDAPYSARVALARCKTVSKDLTTEIKHLDDMGGKPSDPKFTDQLNHIRRVATTFKSAVLLFRDVANNEVTHELLHHRSHAEDQVHEVEAPHTSGGGSKPARKGRKHRGPKNTSPDIKPSEKLSLFDATISFIVDENGSESTADHDELQSSACVCGRRRVGRWFPVRGKYDTTGDGGFGGSDFINARVISNAGLQQFVQPLMEPIEVTLFGKTITVDECINLSWQVKDDPNSYMLEFYVTPNTEDYDLIVGKSFLLQHGYGYGVQKDTRRLPQSSFMRTGHKSRDEAAREEKEAKDKREAALAALKEMDLDAP